MLAGLSALGVKLSVGFETVSGQKPTEFNVHHRINSIGGISIEPETIDASALEDFVERSVAGRATSGGNFTVAFNATDETIAEWETTIEDYQEASANQLRMWVQIAHPNMSRAFFVVAQPPLQLPMPDIGQNELFVMELPLTIEEYVGLDTKVTATDSDAA